MVKKSKVFTKDSEYLKRNRNKKSFRLEILFTPILIVFPLIVGLLLISDWYIRDYLNNSLDLFGELMLGIIIIIGNIVFDIPLIKSIKRRSK